MSSILIKNGKVWDGESFFLSDVLCVDSTVCEILPNIDKKADFIYDASNKIVSAGLVDAHMHMRGVSCERFGAQAEAGSFPFGVTAGADASAELGSREILDSFMLKNVVFVCSKFADNVADFSEAERALKVYGDKAIGIKVYFDTKVSKVSDITALESVCKFAREKGIKVMVHSSNSPTSMAEILSVLSSGDILTHAFHGGKNNASEDFESVKKAQKRGVVIDVGLAGHIHTDFEVFRRAIDCGVIPNVISTDLTRRSLFTRGGKYGMTVCMSVARTLGMSEEDVFRAVTSAPAKALGKESEWGYLSVNKNADIAVFDYDGDGFDFTDKVGNRICKKGGYRCLLTVSDGQVVFRR